MKFLEIFSNKKVLVVTNLMSISGNSNQILTSSYTFTGTIIDEDEEFIKLSQSEDKSPIFINRKHILYITEYLK